VPLPDAAARREILNIYLNKMSLGKINVDAVLSATDSFSGADIKSLVTEAGYFAIRDSRGKVSQSDFDSALEKLKKEDDNEFKKMFN